MKDIFGNSKPVQIDGDEWWFNGRFIQKQNHPLLSRYVSFNDAEDSSTVTHATMKEATRYCLDHPCQEPTHRPNDFLK